MVTVQIGCTIDVDWLSHINPFDAHLGFASKGLYAIAS